MKFIVMIFASLMNLLSCDLAPQLVKQEPDTKVTIDNSKSNIQLYNMSATVSDVITTTTKSTVNLSECKSFFNEYNTSATNNDAYWDHFMDAIHAYHNWEGRSSRDTWVKLANGNYLFRSSDFTPRKTGNMGFHIYVEELEWILGPNNDYGRFICNTLGLPYRTPIIGCYAHEHNEGHGDHSYTPHIKQVCSENDYYSTVYNWFVPYYEQQDKVLSENREYSSDRSVEFDYYIENTNTVTTLPTIDVSYTPTGRSLPFRGTIVKGGSTNSDFDSDARTDVYYRTFTEKVWVKKHRVVADYLRVRNIKFDLNSNCTVDKVSVNSDLVYHYVIENNSCFIVMKEDVLPQTGNVITLTLSLNGETEDRSIEIIRP